MKMTITVETERTIILSRRITRYRCGRCGEETKMLTLEDASAVNGENTETISQRILSGELHTVKIENGQTLICFDSMIQDKTKLLNKEQNNENE